MPKGVPADKVPAGGAPVLLKICEDHGLNSNWAGQVVRFGAERRDGWRVCCHGSCEVCVQTLGRAIDAWRAWVDAQSG